jgi:hypothetical protein
MLGISTIYVPVRHEKFMGPEELLARGVSASGLVSIIEIWPLVQDCLTNSPKQAIDFTELAFIALGLPLYVDDKQTGLWRPVDQASVATEDPVGDFMRDLWTAAQYEGWDLSARALQKWDFLRTTSTGSDAILRSAFLTRKRVPEDNPTSEERFANFASQATSVEIPLPIESYLSNSSSALPEKPLSPRERTSLLGIIGSLLELMLEPGATGASRSGYIDQASIINGILVRHPNSPGLSTRNLESKFAEANRILRSS